MTARLTSGFSPHEDHLTSLLAFYVMDRGYVDSRRLYIFTLSAAFFVVRTKSNVLLQRCYSHPVDKTTGVRSDHTVILTAIDSAKACPETLRRVSYLDVFFKSFWIARSCWASSRGGTRSSQQRSFGRRSGRMAHDASESGSLFRCPKNDPEWCC